VTVRAYDGVGNWDESQFEKWWTDQDAPIIVSVVPSNDAPAISEDVTITTRITDNVGVDSVILSYNNVDHDMNLDEGDAQDGYWVHTIPGSGTETALTYIISAYDETGNEVTSEPYGITWSLIDFTLTIWPPEGYGDTTVYGTGFAHNSVITLTWNGQILTTTPNTIVTDDHGEFTAIINRMSLEVTLNPSFIEASDEYGNTQVATFTALDAPPGEIGSTGEPGQEIPSGYLAGLFLLIVATSFLISLTVTWKNQRWQGANSTTQHQD
jgi:hypothetical protein